MCRRRYDRFRTHSQPLQPVLAPYFAQWAPLGHLAQSTNPTTLMRWPSCRPRESRAAFPSSQWVVQVSCRWVQMMMASSGPRIPGAPEGQNEHGPAPQFHPP